MMLRCRLLSVTFACFALVAADTGCALRATTDFGPQSETSKRSINAGPEGLPGVPIYGNGESRPDGLRGGEGE